MRKINRKLPRLFSAMVAVILTFFALLGSLPFDGLGLRAQTAHALDNGLALTPPMGWNSWNRYGCKINEQLIRDMADTIVSSGMKDAGYEYINIDDCWSSPDRDADGNLQAHPVTFPSGIKALADYVHSKGLKLGIYSSNGTLTCRGRPASFGHEEQDAQKFAEWGIDLLKYDWCYHPGNYTGDIDKISINGMSYEAEAAALSGKAAIVNCVNCSGGKKVDKIGNNEGALVFNNIQVPENGTYDLDIAYTLDRNPAGSWNLQAVRQGMIRVNNGEGVEHQFVDPSGLKYKNSGVNEDDWYLVDNDPNRVGTLSVKVNLKAGNNTIEFYNPMDKITFAQYAYTRMRDALLKTDRPIVFSLCEWGENQPWLWGEGVGHMWRTTGDISDNWDSVSSIIDSQAGREKYAGPGHWNDPDMLEVGNGGMTDTEYRAHFSMWSMLASPLIAGNDLTKMTEATKEILLNKEVIAINQDPLGVQASKLRDDGDEEVWVKRLAGGDIAVALFNRGKTTQTIEVSASDVGFEASASYRIRDLWMHSETVSSGLISSNVPSHGLALYRVSINKEDPDATLPMTTLALSAPVYISAGKTFEVQATLTNHGLKAIENVDISVQAPAGWEIQPVAMPADAQVEPGKSVNATLSVTSPAAAASGIYALVGSASYTYGNLAGSIESTVNAWYPSTPPKGEAYLSDIDWIDATNGWGPVERNQSVGESKENDGKKITLNGVVYEKGLGVNAPSEITYYLDGKSTLFTSDIGVDDEVGNNGSVVFQVWADGTKQYDSGVMRGSSETKSIDLDVTGVEVLKLVVTDGGDNKNYDHADWANAKIFSPLPDEDLYLSDLTWISSSNGFGPVERDMSNGESKRGDGRPITLNGVVYPKGLGAHARSEIVYGLEGRYATFTSVVGVDDEVGDRGSIVFQVWADGKQIYDSGLMLGSTPSKNVHLDIDGVDLLKLVITTGGDDDKYDHGDWANAKLSKEKQSPTGIAADMSEHSLKIGETHQAVISAVYEDGSHVEVSASEIVFASANAEITMVDDKGMITAIGEGSTTITASYAGYQTEIAIVVERDVNPPKTEKIVWTAPGSVGVNEQFDIRLGLGNVSEPKLAQDITLQYDPGVMEFIEADSLLPGVQVLNAVQVAPGQIRLIVISEGMEHAVTADGDVLRLAFKSGQPAQAVTGIVSAVSAILADAAGREVEAQLASVDIRVVPAPAGIPEDVNGDGKVSISDLAIVAAHYGKSGDSPDWEQVKAYDVNGDGVIDIQDLTAVARKILES